MNASALRTSVLLTMVRYCRYGSSAIRLVGDRSKADPTSAGDQRFRLAPKFVLPAAPCTISIATKRTRFEPAAASRAQAVPAGTIASRKGRATVAPRPRSIVRRDRCLLAMYITVLINLYH